MQNLQNFFVGVDVGGTNIRVACSDADGNIRRMEKFATRAETGLPFEEIVARRIEETAAAAGGTARAVGVGIPGTYHAGEVIMSPNIPPFSARRLIARFAEKAIPLTLLNDVKCAALGEHWKGGAQASDNFIFLNIGTGLSLAWVQNGRVYLGHNACAGEIGYWISRPGDMEGYAAGRAPLEEKFSGRWLAKNAGRALGQSSLTTRDIFREYRAGDAAVKPVVDEGVRYLAAMLADVCLVADPELIVLGGGVANGADCFLPALREYLSRTVPFPPRLALSSLEGTAGIYGAVRLALDSISSDFSPKADRPSAAGRKDTRHESK